MRKPLIAAAFILASLVLASSGGVADEPPACSDRRNDPREYRKVPNEQLRYEPAVVKLSGILVMDAHYGPPGYGEEPENDEIEQSWILKLDRRVDVIGDPYSDLNSDPVGDVLRVQLVNTSKTKLNEHVAQRVMLEGMLFHSHTGHHHTKVLLQVQKVTRLKNERPPIYGPPGIGLDVPGTTLMRDLTPAQMDQLLAEIQRAEGWRPGTVYYIPPPCAEWAAPP